MFHGGIILSVSLEEDLLGCDGIGGLAYLLFCAAYWSRAAKGISAFEPLLSMIDFDQVWVMRYQSEI